MNPEEPRRRRRSAPVDEYAQSSTGRRFPVWLLFPLVVVLGLALGAIIARTIGSKPQLQSSSTVAVAPLPTETTEPTLSPSAAPTATISPAPKPTRSPHETPLPSTAPSPSSAPTVPPTVRPTGTPRPSPTPLHRAAPLSAPAATAEPPPAPSNAAVGVVRAYLEDIRRGNFSAATQYLASGDPTETFIETGSRIGNYTSRQNSDGTTHVTADVTTARGTYFLTFTVDNTDLGQRIVDHTAIKP